MNYFFLLQLLFDMKINYFSRSKHKLFRQTYCCRSRVFIYVNLNSHVLIMKSGIVGGMITALKKNYIGAMFCVKEGVTVVRDKASFSVSKPLLFIISPQPECFRGYTGISLSVRPCVSPSVCSSVYKILVSVKALAGVLSHI